MKTQIRYKLTNRNLTTHGNYKWHPLRWKQTDGNGGLCGPGWLHCYADPLVAVFMNPKHANIDNPLLWVCQVRGQQRTAPDFKEGWTEMRLIKRMDCPSLTLQQRVAVWILCAKEVYHEPTWVKWANQWLSSVDRSYNTAYAAAADAPCPPSAFAAAYAAAAYAAAYAAAAAADAAAAYAAADAAAADAAAAAAAAADIKTIDLSQVLRYSMKHF